MEVLHILGASQMRHGRIVHCLAVVLLMSMSCYRPPAISSPDRREIVQDALFRALVAKQIPDHSLLRDPTHVVVSTNLIAIEDIPALTGIVLEPLSEEAIHSRANATGDFLHLRFSQFAVLDPEHVVVHLANVWARCDTSRVPYLSGGGMMLKYFKRAGRWVGEVVGTWIS
jgi:hypothetical protein